MNTILQYDIAVLGGGTAGITVAARLREADPTLRIAIVEPSDTHYYQPIWTLVGGGVVPREVSARPTAHYIPEGVDWLQTRVTGFRPEEHQVELADGRVLQWQQLVVALGIQLQWERIKGLSEAMGHDGVCSNYSYDTVNSTWDALQRFDGGNAIFTFPPTAMKCAGAPQKIMWLAEDYLRKHGKRDRANVIFASSGMRIFGVEHYAKTLRRMVVDRHIDTQFRLELVEVRGKSREAVFKHLDEGREVVLPYNLLHVVPPQAAPDVIRQSALADSDGWVEVNKHTLQHVRYPDVFALGDNASLPTSRTGAAIRKQAPIAVANLLAHRRGQPLTGHYNGYTSCPIVTGYGRLILAEFDYDSTPCETFPFDQSQERYSMYAMKLYVLPEMYWNGMLRGRA